MQRHHTPGPVYYNPGLPSKQIFGQSRLSTAPPRTTFSSDASTAPVMETLPDNDFGCSTCAFIISALEAKLDDDATREEIREALMHVCKNVGSLLRPMCEEIMEAYSDSIFDLLLAKYPVQKICEEIKLCKKKMETATENNSIQCSICTWVIDNIQAKITNETTEEEIIQFV
ncbi:hypothetical protein P9112_000450 [Eukaryota sp. TZLM1-RC]